ncbi:MAG: NINE protein [Saprospiraceae bacterium]|nr:NINE protein [Saprospiraceae bacterium]MCF8249088.1 NINE protein [Saprospiraceae bacterium]MCF8280955.1 NINE protein [Bacteroidales bacterium]MCF8311110.1 NINE protein [Saprospiraceae bacterium]MCF8440200.1 NINE protein [Saprospiraceae bacterium]
MRDKNVAGILALFLGWVGIHRFYLGQVGRGILYAVFFWFPLVWLIGLIDAIVLFSMDNDVFDAKYNKENWQRRQQHRPDFQRGRPTDFERQKVSPPAPPRPAPKARANRPNPFKQSGLDKFKDFDYSGAIADFIKSLEIAPQDIATHFNLACAYSLVEDKENALLHLDQAIQFGFKDFQKIKEHHALAYLRIQNDFEQFEENGFRLVPKTTQNPVDTQRKEDLLAAQPDLLDRLKKLAELREHGLLTELEFQEEQRKLMGG